MAPSLLLATVGLGTGLLGVATASDLVSLRAVAHMVDVPMVSGAVILLRETMPATMAHALEPVAGLVGGLIAACTLARPARSVAAVLARRHTGRTLRLALALGLLRTS